MTTAAIKPDDLVQLKSGGPIMTVERLSGVADRHAECTWFDDKKKRHKETFEVGNLVVISPEALKAARGPFVL